MNQQLETLCASYRSAVGKQIRSVLGPHADAETVEDLIQDVFLYCIENESTIDFNNGPVSWLLLKAKHRAINHLKSSRSFSSITEVESPESTDEFSTEDVEVLKTNFSALPHQEQNLIFLRFWQGYTLEKCAERLHSTKTTVERRLKQVVSKLHAEHTKVPAPKFASFV